MRTRCIFLFLLLCSCATLSAQADEYSRWISKRILREDSIYFEYLKDSIAHLHSEQPREVNPDTTSTAVGAMGGTFGVSATGGATYTIPIDVPQGIGGLQPSLSIVYNSQSGNGLCGYGTNLSGISCITRGPKDIYHDGSAQGIQYDADDALYLDGVRLILSSGTPGQNGAEYTPESDPYTRVIIHGNCTSTYNNIYYEVRGSDGMTYWYGDDYGSYLSYIDGNGAQKKNLWYLTYAVQPSGNYIYYFYQEYDNYILPFMIAYGVNENQMSSSYSIVEFAYETRTDAVPIRFDGRSGSMNRRLKTITCKTNDEVFRSYTLNYNTTGDGTAYKYSRLTSVTEKNGQQQQLPPTQLNWSYLPAVNYVSTNINSHINGLSSPTVSIGSQNFGSCDLNGDGIDDIIGYGKSSNESDNKIYIYKYLSSRNNNGVSFAVDHQYSFTPSYTTVSGDVSDELVQELKSATLGGSAVIDYDGDGRNEYLIGRLFKTYDMNANGTSTLNKYMEFFMLREEDNFNYSRTRLTTNCTPLYSTGDIDNDGRSDLIVLETQFYDGIFVKLHILSASVSPAEYTYDYTNLPVSNSVDYDLHLPYTPRQLFVADMNGNGLQDLLVIYDNGYSVFWNRGGDITGSNLLYNGNVNNYFHYGQELTSYYMMVPGDYNGDGMMDVLANGAESNSWYFFISNGDGSFTCQTACTLNISEQSFTDRDNDKFSCNAVDFDSDGRTDIIVTKADYEYHYFMSETWGTFLQTDTYWMRSTGTSLSQVYHATSSIEDDGLSKRYVTGDFNGDGRIELINYGYDCVNSSNSNTDPIWRIYCNSNLTTQTGKVTSITGDFGVTTSITYFTLADSAVYTRGSLEPYPAPRYTIPLNVVKQTVQDNGAAGNLTTRYTYEGLKVHLSGRGMLGFSKTTANCTTTGIATESGVTQWDTAHYIPKVTYAKTIIGSNQSQTTNTLTIVNKGGKRYFAYPSQTVETDFDGNTVTTVRGYNTTYGYPTGETTTYGTNMYQSVTYSDYILAGGSYHPRTVVTTQRHADDTSPFSTTTKYSYSGNGFVTRKTENQHSSDSLATCYTYDDFGNLTSQVSTGNGITTPLTTYYTYERTHRFPVRIYTSPVSTVQKYTYDLWGNVLTSQDSINQSITNTVTHTYDAWGNLIRTQAPDGTETTYTRGWNNSSSQRWFILEQGTAIPWVKTWYDNCGRQVKTESVGPMNVDVGSTTTYNSKGLVSGRTDTNGNLTLSYTYTYDSRGRIISETRPGNSTVTYSYGSNGRTKTVSDNGRQTTYTYDAIGNLKTVQAPQSSTVTHTYSSNGGIKTTVSDGSTWTFQYDDRGNRTVMTDPDAGTTTYTYDALGRETQRVDGRGVAFVTNYDYLGRVTSRTADNETTTYTYGTSGTGQTRLVSESNGHWGKNYVYDTYGRVTQEIMRENSNDSGSMGYHYNSNGLLSKRDYPNAKSVSYSYDAYGNCTTVNFENGCILWTLTGYTGSSTTSTIKLANTTPYVRTTRLDNAGNIQSRVMTRGSDTLQYDSYVFNSQTGNLTSRTLTGRSAETFTYDNLDRLTQISGGNQSTLSMTYSVNGNISTKDNMGQYSYNSTSKPHAVNSISPVDGIPEYGQDIEYTPWNRVGYIYYAEEVDYYFYNIEYGPDQQRVESCIYKNDVLQYKKFYWDDYEAYLYKKSNNSDVLVFSHWIEAPDGLAGFYWNSSDEYYLAIHPYVAMTDHLGSLTGLYDHNGYKTLDATYDAWGKRTFAAGSMQMDRGFTGHEHIDALGLINMNGRMYDPLQGRFLSPDNYIQAPDNPQNYNRYSYCLNNPLKYTDPDGEFWHIVIGAAVGGIINLASNWNSCDGFWEYAAAFGVGAGSGALTAATGGASTGLAIGAVALGGAATSATNNLIAQTDNNFSGPIDWGQVGRFGIIGAVAGTASYGASSWAISNLNSPILNGMSINSPVLEQGINGAIGGAAGGLAGGFVGGYLMSGFDVSAGWNAAISGLKTGVAIGGSLGAFKGYIKSNKTEQPKMTPQAKGQQGVNRAIEEIKSGGGEILGKEVSLDVGDVRVRVDLAAKINNKIQLIEVKNGPYARFTSNQKIAYPLMESTHIPVIPRGNNAVYVWGPEQIGKPTTAYSFTIKHY